MTKRENPILMVTPTTRDHRPPVRVTPGPPKVFGNGACKSRREELAEQTDQILDFFQSEFKRWPDLPAVAKITLKEEAIAKSHRPTALFSQSTCPIIGTMGFGEILVSATPQGLKSLKNKILTTEAKKPTANISTIEKIEPFTERERLNYYDWNQLNKKINNSLIKLSIFDHQDFEENEKLKKALFELAKEHNIPIEELHYGSIKNLYVARVENDSVRDVLGNFIGLRSVLPMPYYQTLDTINPMVVLSNADISVFPAPDATKDYPVVGVIDSGVCPNNTLLSPWVVARESYVPSGLEDYNHGTMVAGLIVNSKALNHNDHRFPSSQAKIVDVNVFPRSSVGISEDDLISAIAEVIPKYPEVKIWNLSLGASNPVGETDFSDLACFLDEMHDKYQCLFIIAAGNQSDNSCWPTMDNIASLAKNRLSSPADSVRGLTVGSLAHKDTPLTLVRNEDVSPFSRIGPGPCFIPKPEITHYGGNNCINGNFTQTGVISLGPNNTLCENIGTSFATPIVSSLAAEIYHFLSYNKSEKVTPEMVKALLIHSALISNTKKVSATNLHYYGFGRPQNITDTLYCESNSITLFFNVDVRHGGFEFEKVPFPMASCLLTSDGKFKGEILMTLVYSPLTDKSFASEYCRTNVDVGMGSYDFNEEKGKNEFHSLVPATPDDINERYEVSQIEHGFKWSPVKAYYKRFPRGTGVETWRLKMKVMRRAEEDMPQTAQNAILVLTIRSLDPELPVYNEMIQEFRSMGWVTQPIDNHLRLRP
ncbi:S8 family anti-phage peptidase IteS [Acinetobacter sp. 22301]|uniref:S8 family anti-phage peptidase IteS n=1 Tax=Acinetobacter sp. 22301 TaxID=3453904 RepID=UPI003F825F1E